MGIFENSSNAASRMMSDGRELLNQGRKTDNNSSSNENEQPPGAGAKSSESPDEGLSNRPRGMRLFLVVFALLLTMFLVSNSSAPFRRATDATSDLVDSSTPAELLLPLLANLALMGCRLRSIWYVPRNNGFQCLPQRRKCTVAFRVFGQGPNTLFAFRQSSRQQSPLLQMNFM